MKVYSSVKEFREEVDSNNIFGGLPVYMTSGGFDPLHVGHLRCILATVDMAADGPGSRASAIQHEVQSAVRRRTRELGAAARLRVAGVVNRITPSSSCDRLRIRICSGTPA